MKAVQICPFFFHKIYQFKTKRNKEILFLGSVRHLKGDIPPLAPVKPPDSSHTIMTATEESVVMVTVTDAVHPFLNTYKTQSVHVCPYSLFIYN